jgi:cytidine deaminase
MPLSPQQAAAAQQAHRAAGFLPPDLAADLAGNAPIAKLLLDLLPLAQRHAIAPLSHFAVGAVSLGTSGALYLGANCEIPGAALGFTVHAEQAAVAQALRFGETGIAALAVSAAPCGSCRQFLYELTTASQLQIVLPDTPPAPLTRLFPQAFGPGDLGITAALMSPQDHRLVLAPAAPAADPAHAVHTAHAAHAADAAHAAPAAHATNATDAAHAAPTANAAHAAHAAEATHAAPAAEAAHATAPAQPRHGHHDDPLVAAALQAANTAYAPYTLGYAGAALRVTDGSVYSGALAENAAFNPSLPPLAAALVDLAIRGSWNYDAIVDAVLVEAAGATASQIAATRIALAAITHAPLRVYTAVPA